MPRRKPLRLKGCDYNTPGSYFITICTHNKSKILSDIVGAIHESPVVNLTKQGEIAEAVIKQIPTRFGVSIDQYVIMPNHIHLIIVIKSVETLRAIRESPLRARSVISNVVGYIKMNVSKQAHHLLGNAPIWQRGYHDHVIRDWNDYTKIATYILENPKRWLSDCFYVETV